MEWYFAKDGQQSGPFERAVLEQMLASGQIAPGDLVWNEGMANWTPAGTVAELNGLIPNRTAAVQQVQLPAPGATYIAPPPPGFVAPPPQFGGGEFNAAKSHQGMAIAGFIVALAGLPCFICVTYITAPTGLVLSLVALNGMKKSGNDAGRGLAIAGAIIAGVCLLIDLLVFIFSLANNKVRGF